MRRFVATIFIAAVVMVGVGYYLRPSGAHPVLAGGIPQNTNPGIPSTGTATSTDPLAACTSLPRSSVATDSSGGGPMISFNFDDGFLSAYQIGIPIVHAAGFHATEYIITGNFHKPGYIDQQQVAALAASGDEIGGHTRTHPHLSKISEQQAIDEICGSRADLIALGITPTTFAYPEGDFSPSVEQIVSAAGYAAARNTQAGLNNAQTNPLLLRSYQVTASSTLPQVEYAIDQAVQNKEWLILTFHRFDDTGNAVSIPHQLLQGIVSYVKTQGIPVVTNSQGLSMMGNIQNTVSGLNDYPGSHK